MAEKELKLQEVGKVVADLESRLQSLVDEREEVVRGMAEASAAVDAKTQTIDELHKTLEDLQMVNDKLKLLLTERQTDIASLKASAKAAEEQQREHWEAREEQLQTEYMEREKSLKLELKQTIGKLEGSVQEISHDAEKVLYIPSNSAVSQ